MSSPLRSRIDREQILAAAAAISDSDGLGTLTTTRLAERLRIKPPSLYQHFPSIEMVRDALATRALGELIDLHKDVTAGRTGREALHALAHAHRTYAQARPGRYLAAMQASSGGTATSTLRQTYVRLVAATLETYHMDADVAAEVSRAVVAALQGFVSAEESQRQVETAVNWGRYAELFDFDAARRRFVLPEAQEEEVAASEEEE